MHHQSSLSTPSVVPSIPSLYFCRARMLFTWRLDPPALHFQRMSAFSRAFRPWNPPPPTPPLHTRFSPPSAFVCARACAGEGASGAVATRARQCAQD
eukprot:6196086-Pleurochrysis_carterae.AAC.1